MDSDKLYKATVDNETVYGTGDGAPTPVPLTSDSVPEPLYDEEIDEDYSSSLAEPKTQIGRKRFRLPVKWYLKGTAGAGTAPEWLKLIKAWGCSGTVTPATNVVISPVNSGHPSVKIVTNINGYDWTVTGFRGTSLTIPFIAGKRVMIEGVGEGRYATPAAQAYSAPTFADAAINAPRVQSMGLTINGQTHIIPEVRLVMENEQETIDNVNAANDGIESIEVTKRKWYLDIPALRDTNNDIEWFTLFQAGTEFALASTGFGSAGGNRFQIDISNLQIVSIKHTSYKSKVAYTVRCKILKGTTLAGEFSLTND